MKRFFKFAVVLTLGFVFNSSCSKKSDDVTPAMPVCQVKKITTTSTISNTSATTAQTFEYDFENKLSKITSEYSGTNANNSTTLTGYNYTNGVITSAASGSALATWTVQDKKLLKVTSGTSSTDISYDADGRLMKMAQPQYSVTYTTVYDANGNMHSDMFVVASSNQNFSDSRTYSGFDSEMNPYSMLAQSMGLTYYFEGFNPGPFLPEALSQNNPGSSVVTHTEAGHDNSFTLTWTYTYDASGRLTKSVQTSGQATTVRTFEYSNCD